MKFIIKIEHFVNAVRVGCKIKSNYLYKNNIEFIIKFHSKYNNYTISVGISHILVQSIIKMIVFTVL